MLSKNKKGIATLLLCTIALLPFVLYCTSAFAATTLELFDGGLKITDNVGTGSGNATEVTITAKGGLFSKTTNTITIENASGATKEFHCSFTVSNANSHSFGSNSGEITEVMTAGETLTYTIQSKGGYGTVTLKLSNIEFNDVAATSNVTVTYGSLGSVTIDGTTVASGSVNSVNSATGASFVAVPGIGNKFVAWINPSDNAVISTKATYQLVPAEDMAVRAVFASTSAEPVFFADGTAKVFESFDAAISYANSASNKTITLASDATLAAGNYTIPSGVTLLIPRDAANTVETKPGDDGNSTYIAPTVYRKLTMASGANIAVNGTINIGGKIGTYMIDSEHPNLPPYVNGAPSGPLGYIDMGSESSITVNSGGSLYAWGFVTGSGSVTVKNGGNVYEDLQIRDYRGGDATSGMVENSSKVFPFTQYYVQNIEVPLTLEYGATETVCMAVSVTLMGVQKENVVFVGKEAGLIRLSKGSLSKTYDGSTDRIIYDLNGDVSFANLNVSIKVSTIGTITINSEDYVMPINSNMTLNVNAGSNVTVNQDLALLPGSQVNIAEGATCTLGTGNSIYVYDTDQWASSYVGIVNKKWSAVYYAPGRTYTRTEADLVDAAVCVDGILDASAGYLYTTTGGANIYSTGTGVVKMTAGTQANTHQYIQSSEKYADIPINSAWLKNGNASYVQSETNTYVYQNGKWMPYFMTNVSLGNNLDVYFAVLDYGENSVQRLTGPNGDASSLALTDGSEIGLTGYKYIIYSGLAAKQMTKAVALQVSNDKLGNMVREDSIRNYAKRLLAKYSTDATKTELCTLLVDMLNYGAACQTYFGYNTTDLANTDITSTGSTYTFDGVSTATPGVATYFDGSQLVTTGNIQFAVKATAEFTSGMTVSISYQNHWGTPVTGNLKVHEDGYYYIDTLVVADAKQTITITVNGVKYEDSIERYCARMYSKDDATDTQKAVFLAFMKFSVSAEAYLEQTDGGRLP